MSMMNSAARGMAWTSLERFGGKIITFFISLVLARLLTPADYGIIGMLTLFTAIAQSVMDCGFGSALIQKKNRTDIDYSTVFVFNLAVVMVLYGTFFVSAPFIADFYRMPELVAVTRVVTIGLVLDAFSLVQTTRMTIGLDFRTQTQATLLSIAVAGVIGITLAYCGWGVWALVWQSVAGSVMRMAYLWLVSSWRPRFAFSTQSFRGLFAFGSRLFFAGIISTVYGNVQTLVIGKLYSPSDLGHFTRANGFASMAGGVSAEVMMKVNYPILSELQNDDYRLLSAYGRLLRTPMFVIAPVLTIMSALAEPLVVVLIGNKWLPCVPMLSVLCFAWMFAPLARVNLNLLYVKGRSDLVLRLEVIKKSLAFAILFGTMRFGVMPVCWGMLAYGIVAFALNCRYTKKLLDYGLWAQVRSLLPIAVNCAVAYVVSRIASGCVSVPWMRLSIGGISGVLSYLSLAILVRDETLSLFADRFLRSKSVHRHNGEDVQ